MAFSPTSVGGRSFTLEWDKKTLGRIRNLGPEALGEIADVTRDHVKARAPVAARHKKSDTGLPLKQSVKSRMFAGEKGKVIGSGAFSASGLGAIPGGARSRTLGSMVIMRYYGYFLEYGTKRGIEPVKFVERSVDAMASQIDDILFRVWNR